jgi:hypothetical protein
MHAPRFFSGSLVLFTALALCIAACRQDGSARSFAENPVRSTSFAEVPLIFDDSTYVVVPVTIGAQDSLQFVLDTAAYTSVLTPWVQDTIGLAESDTMTVSGASGQAAYQTVNLDSIQVGGRVVRRLRTPVIDLARLERSDIRYAGILGNDVLKNFDVVYDLPNRRLRLYPLGADSATSIAGLDTLQRVFFEDIYGGAAGFVKLRLSVGTGTAEAVLDTGAPQSIFNWKAAALEGLTEDAAQKLASGTQGLNYEEATDTYLYTINDVRAGPVRFAPTEVRVADLPVFRALGLGDEAAVIMGNDFVANRMVVIAYSTGSMYFSEPF